MLTVRVRAVGSSCAQMSSASAKVALWIDFPLLAKFSLALTSPSTLLLALSCRALSLECEYFIWFGKQLAVLLAIFLT